MASDSTPRYIIPQIKAYGHTTACSWMFIVALFIIAKRCKQPKCLSTNESINESQYIYSVEYYVAIKRDEPWEIMVSQRSQSQRPHIMWFHSYEMCRMGDSIKTESRLTVP